MAEETNPRPQTGSIPADEFRYRLVLSRMHAGDLTIKQAAAKCGLNYGSWSNWERGALPRDRVDAAQRISDGLGIDFDWLLFGRTGLAARHLLPDRSDDDLNCVSVQVAAPVPDQPRHAAIRTTLRHPTRRATSSGHGRTTRRAVRLTTCATDGDS